MELHEFTYETPVVELLGQMEELTGSRGAMYADGWGYCPLAPAE